MVRNVDTDRKWVQSFIPAAPYVDFVDLRVTGPSGNTSAIVYIALRSQSIDGPIIASTDPITIPPGYRNPDGWTRFTFPSGVNVPNFRTYYFEPMVRSESGELTGVTFWGGMSMYTAGVL